MYYSKGHRVATRWRVIPSILCTCPERHNTTKSLNFSQCLRIIKNPADRLDLLHQGVIPSPFFLGPLIQVFNEKSKSSWSRIKDRREKEVICQVFLFTNHMLLTTRASNGRLHLAKVSLCNNVFICIEMSNIHEVDRS